MEGVARMVMFATRHLMFAASLSLLGCATAGKAKVEPVASPPVLAEQAPSPPAGPAVMHYMDGREGFQIKEFTTMDRGLRADFDQATLLLKEAKYDKASELLEKVVAQSPEMTAPHINLAIAYGHINKPEQAEPHLKKALELIPGHPVASNEYGLLLRKAGRFAESRQIYEKSLALFPEYPPIHRNLGILCDLYLNDPACALQQYGLYTKSMPKDEQVKLWIAGLNARLGQPSANAKQ